MYFNLVIDKDYDSNVIKNFNLKLNLVKIKIIFVFHRICTNFEPI